jgi:hypothetical protein
MMTNSSAVLRALRWSARILSLMALAIVLLFIFGEGPNLTHFTPHELVLFSFFPIGVCLGMLFAWRWEGWGGGITVASLAGFYLVDRVFSSSFPRGYAFIAIASPGFLFLLCSFWTCSTTKRYGV